MAISVVCPGCRARFQVADKFAGKQGPCPKCKKPITIPKVEEQVKVHEREGEPGAKDAKGQSTLKPISRTEAKFNPIAAVVVGIAIVAAFVVAFAMRVESKPTGKAGKAADKTAATSAAAETSPDWPPRMPLTFVAEMIALAPFLCWAGYQFLRDAERMETHRGASLWLRTAACSAAYAGLWAVYAVVLPMLVEVRPEMFSWLYIGPPFLALGTVAAFACYDLDISNAFMHYALYLLVTALLRVTMGLPVV